MTRPLLDFLAIAVIGSLLATCGAGSSKTNGGGGTSAAAGSQGSSGAGGSITINLNLDSGLRLIPAVDGGVCYRLYEGTTLVCFGSDPGPYQTYLALDAGVTPGECPSLVDFPPTPGDDYCAYVGCGPLLPSAAAELQQEADASTVGGGTDCCFFVSFFCQP
jgi:hypothetical protein